MAAVSWLALGKGSLLPEQCSSKQAKGAVLTSLWHSICY